MASVLGLSHYASKTRPCSLCKCTATGTHTWSNNSSQAPWIATTYTTQTWKEEEEKPDNALFSIPGVSILTVCLDYMHAKYIGMDQYMYGSTFYYLVFYVMNKSAEENLEEIWQFLQKYYSDHDTPVRYNYLNKLSMFVRKSGWPKLRGKAGEVKHLCHAMLAIWSKWMDESQEIHRQIHLMLKLNTIMEDILMQYKLHFALPTQAAARFKKACLNLMNIQNQIAKYFLDQNIKLYDVTVKSHMVVHNALLSDHINPAKCWCFRGEDYMSHCQRLASSCFAGNNIPSASIKFSEKYRLALSLNLMKLEQELCV